MHLDMSFCVCSAHITQVYSNIGLTRDLLELTLTDIGQLQGVWAGENF